MTDEYEAFVGRLHGLVGADGIDVAANLAARYWAEPYTGRFFHELADDVHPDEITSADIVAVTMLGVSIPAPVTIWLLSGEGRRQVGALLRSVPTDVDLWNAGPILAEDGELWALWDLLRSASWPLPDPGNDMGPTKLSKILAAKRPRLVPIWDSRVRELFPPVTNYWTAFERALSDDSLRVRLATAANCGAPEGPTFLRKLDAMLWMIANDERGRT